MSCSCIPLSLTSWRITAVIACWAVGATALCAEEKVTLRLDVQAGQTWKFEQSSDRDMTSKATTGGQTQTNANKIHQKRVGTIEILAAKDGRPTSVRIVFGRECSNSMEANGRVQEPVFAFAGQTITVTRGEDGAIQTDFRGQADPDSLAEVKQVLDPDLTLYPDKEVAVGEEWKGNAEVVNKQLEITGPKDAGGMVMKLVAVKELNGRTTAEVAVASEATKDMGGVTRKTESKGTAVIDVKTGHVMSFEVKGTMSIAGTANGRGPNGQPMSVRWDGDGTMARSLVSDVAGGLTTTSPAALVQGVPPRHPSSAPAVNGAAGQTLRFETYTLMDDPTYIGGEVAHFLIPAGWKVDGGIHWDLVSTFPAQMALHVYDPKGPSAFGVYPALLYYWETDRAKMGYHPPLGTKFAGGIVQQPVDDVLPAIEAFVLPTYRKDLLKARVVGKERLPKLSKYVFDHNFGLAGQTQAVSAARVRFEYRVDGQLVEEDLIAALSVKSDPQSKTIDWRISSIISTRGPKGTLDDLKMLRLVMQRSTLQNLQWYNKLSQLAEMANRAKLAEIKAVGERSRIFAEMNNHVTDARRKMFEETQRGNAERALVADQYIRDVTPYNTTQGPPVELPSAYGHAWQGTNGYYIMTNDPLYDPNSDPNYIHTGWTLLQPKK